MDSWTAAQVPRLPGTGPRLRLHDTATGTRVPTPAGERATMYACGITPYDATHMGHAATYLAWDLVVRVWRDAGHGVAYVQNVTDVDDPLLERAERDGVDWRDLAAAQIQLYRDDMAALRVLPPDALVGAVEAIPVIADLVVELEKRSATYEVGGDLYFPVGVDAEFGSVSHLGHEEMVTLSRENGGDPDRPGKKDPVDPLLWRHERPGEPSWPSVLGPGRPGWHVECTAIAQHHLGATVDVQAGGRDLVFPHHEMGASHGRVATGEPFARVFAHAGLVGLDGEKMSKSRGNLVFVSALRRAGTDPAAIRLALLAHHYRDDWGWTDADLAAAADRLARWRTAVAAPAGPPAGDVLAAVRARLADDLDAPGALAAVDAWVAGAGAGGDDVGAGDDPAAPALVRDLVDALLGIAL